ncbi:MAG: di-heme oxidoredictase family protein [Steroidobacteraceae bacterium]
MTALLPKPNVWAALGPGPEMSAELLDALLTFEKWLSVPANPMLPDPGQQAAGLKLFKATGCHSVTGPNSGSGWSKCDGQSLRAIIAPYTDLATHDLGPGLADHDLSGAVHPTRWRTPPLWSMGIAWVARSGLPSCTTAARVSLEEAVCCGKTVRQPSCASASSICRAHNGNWC